MAKLTKSHPAAGAARSDKQQPPLLSRYVIFSITLFLIILAVASAAFLFSMQQIIRTNKGRELVKLLELERIKLEMSVDREIAIVLKMATAPAIRRYFQNPHDSYMERLAQEDINAYRRSLAGSVFWVSDTDRMFHFDDEPPFPLNINAPENYWYTMTTHNTDEYNFNINYNPDLHVTNLWINAPVRCDSAGAAVGILGTGIDLSAFVSDVYKGYDGRASFYFFNTAGEITGAEDIDLVATKQNIGARLGDIGAETIERALALAPGAVETFSASIGQVAIISIPKLEWFAVAVLPDTLSDFNTALTVFFFLGILVVALILVLSNIFIAGLLTPLRETMASLEAASKAKSDFLARMSHEIRTPLNAIIGIVQIQLQKGKLAEDIEAAFERIYNSGSLLLGIINDILDMSKIETGKLRLVEGEYDVPSLINDAVQFNIVRIESRPIEFKLFVDEKLPARLVGDELRLKQVLNNMLSNAFKYTDKGGVTLTVNHLETGGDAELVIKITDTGQGIKAEDLKELFREYQRFNVNRHTEGTGLGLSITQRLVTMMGGYIDVESVYGEGSTFTVHVRQKMVAGSDVIGAALSEKLRNFTFTGLKHSAAALQIKHERMAYGSVLVVDDVETNLLVAEGFLSFYGLKIETAGSGQAAIEKVKSGKVYDVIFMDHMMPGMDGVETTWVLRKKLNYKGVIVALTANAIVGTEEMFAQNGFDGFISKPIDMRRLDAVLNRFVKDRHRDAAAKAAKNDGPAQKNETPIAPRKVKPVVMNERFLNALRRDVERSIVTLKETIVSGDIKTITTTVHGLKSAFAAVGEEEKSAQALALEMAGRKEDMGFINDNLGDFIAMLEELIKNEH
jgi:signal transduction histidine kinase/CheY-like chemotaxis protein